MADFGINATHLSDPQGSGTGAVAPVQEHVANTSDMPLFSAIGDIFARGLQQNAKDVAAKRKNAVIGEYINNENVYGDALTTGQWNASQTSMASRSNLSKFAAAYPEYHQDLMQARSLVYGGTEVGEAQKKVDAEQKQKEADIAGASAKGFQFYSGMSEQATAATLDAYKTGLRVEAQFKQDTERAAETRAQGADERAKGTYTMSVDDHVAKENAANGAREVASKNFDALTASAQDIVNKMKSGTLSPESAQALHASNVSRIQAGLLAISGKNPEMAAPWIKLFGDIDSNIKAQLDPTKKSADDLKLLQDRLQTLIVNGKLAAVEKNPKMLKAVVSSQLFPGEGMVTLANAPVVRDFMLSSGGNDPSLPPAPQIVGTKDDAAAFKNVKDAVKKLNTMPADQKVKATVEATNIVNTLLDQTTKVDGSMNPASLKEASKFYASTEFGTMALAGQINKQTASNAQRVFQVQYEPAVKSAIIQKLEVEVAPGEPLSRTVGMKLVGGNVVFEQKPIKMPAVSGIHSFIEAGMKGNDVVAGKADLKDAEAGLNQLIRMHAHLEGTTDYAKYWEDHKHELMPTIFPDPNKLKVGQTIKAVNGKSYKYIGGNYNDISGSYMEQPDAGNSK